MFLFLYEGNRPRGLVGCQEDVEQQNKQKIKDNNKEDEKKKADKKQNRQPRGVGSALYSLLSFSFFLNLFSCSFFKKK